MAKVIKFPAPRVLRAPLPPRGDTPEVCQRCGHKADVHIRHPSGVVSCVARGCACEEGPAPGSDC